MLECLHGRDVEWPAACLGRHPHRYPAEQRLASRLDLSHCRQIVNQVRIGDDEVERFASFNLLLYRGGLSAHFSATANPVAASNWGMRARIAGRTAIAPKSRIS